MLNITKEMKKNIIFQSQYNDFPVKKPTIVATLQKYKDKEDTDFLDLLETEFDWNFFGSDTEGGFAFVGKKEDIDIIQKQTEQYIEQAYSNKADLIYFARWDVKDESLLVLFENYSPEENFPVLENVFNCQIGCWTNDDDLNRVLKRVNYWSKDWTVGKEKFDIENEVHKKLHEMAKKLAKEINPNLETDEDYED